MNTTMTALEKAVFGAIQSDMDMYGEEHFSTATLKDIAQATDLSKESVKGVLGSLIKKGLVYDDVRDGCPTVYIIKNYVYDESVKEVAEEIEAVEESSRERKFEELAQDMYQVAKKHGLEKVAMFDLMYSTVITVHGPLATGETLELVTIITNIVQSN